MADIPEDDLEDTRAALAPMLAATNAVLPWLARPRPPRFDPALNQRWVAAGKRLGASWSARHEIAEEALRTAIFALYAIALETADADCLRLGEALASAVDRLEDGTPPVRLIAALSACIETLDEPAGLEHELFGERARHFASRLDGILTGTQDTARSAAIDQIFVDDASEQLELMHDALAVLPPDAYALSSEAAKLAQQAELLEIWGVMQLARQIGDYVALHAAELDSAAHRQTVDGLLAKLAGAIAAVNG